MHIKILRFLLLPLGFIFAVYRISINGSRDIYNKLRFRESKIDQGCCINPSSRITGLCHILENSIILNSSISAFTYIGRNSIVQNASIGSFCSIANDVFIGLGTHPIEHFSTSPLLYRKMNTFNINIVDKDYEFAEYRKIEIGADVWIGSRAIILDGIKISNGAIVAANSVVTKDVPPYAIVAGVPAKIVKYRFSQEKIDVLLKTQWWLLPLEQIKARLNEFRSL